MDDANVDYPTARGRIVYGVNDAGQLGGAFTLHDGKNTSHGFVTAGVATPPTGGGTAVSEPASLALLGAGQIGFAIYRRPV